jgi:hypothetical protein
VLHQPIAPIEFGFGPIATAITARFRLGQRRRRLLDPNLESIDLGLEGLDPRLVLVVAHEPSVRMDRPKDTGARRGLGADRLC